jgi:hypothetical protein
MRRRPALPFRRCGRNCSRSGRRRQAEAGGWREGRGFIGLGRMGSAIAARVLSGDHDLLVFNRHPEKAGGPRSDGRQGCRLDRGRTKCSRPNHFSSVAESLLSFCSASGAPRRETIIALSGKARNQPLKQTSRPITLKPSCCGLGLGASIDEPGG